MRDGNLVPVCGTGQVIVEYSIFFQTIVSYAR
jgi:hypothetical protein